MSEKGPALQGFAIASGGEGFEPSCIRVFRNAGAPSDAR
jgi:hypothetical protein